MNGFKKFVQEVEAAIGIIKVVISASREARLFS